MCPDMGVALKGVGITFSGGHNDDLMSHPDFLMRRLQKSFQILEKGLKSIKIYEHHH